MAAPAYSRRLGIPRSAGDDHGAAIHFALPWKALQLRLSGVPESRGSSRDLETIEARRNRRATDRRLHDGPGSKRQCSYISTPGLHVFLRRGCSRILDREWKVPAQFRFAPFWREEAPGAASRRSMAL